MEIQKREISSLELNWTYLDMWKQDIMDMIDWKWDLTNEIEEETCVDFDESINFFWLKWADFVLFFDNLESRDKAMKLFNENFKAKWLFAEEIEEWVHIPEVVWPFEYKWKIWLWIAWKNPLNDITDIERWIYKWVVINSEKYFWLSENVEEEIEDNSWKVDEII
jgi:hypothetical protein